MKLANITSTYRSKLIEEAFKGWLTPNTKVLDVGCGTGVVGKELSQHFNLQLSGCDIENYVLTNIPFKKITDRNKLPFPNNSFDYALFVDMLHHTSYETQKRLLQEGLRVSKSVLLFELHETFTGKILDYLLNKIHHPTMAIPYTYRTRKQWIQLAKELHIKFEVRKVRKPFLYPFTHMAFRFTRK
jgi:ubiquinone/menaquinone biosynthesis C-methylase UbiE